MAENMTGMVESSTVTLSTFVDERHDGSAQSIMAEIVLRLDDGTRVYVTTGIGTRIVSDNGGVVEYTPNATEAKATRGNRDMGYWPHVAVTTSDMIIRGTMPLPAVWEGDIVQIRGTVELKTSATGNRYLKMNRAHLTAQYRAGALCRSREFSAA